MGREPTRGSTRGDLVRSRTTNAGGIRRASRLRALGLTFAFVLLVAILSSASFFVLGQTLIRPKFDRLERERVATLLHDVNKRVENEVSVVDATALQNSNWSGLYDVMAKDARPFL